MSGECSQGRGGRAGTGESVDFGLAALLKRCGSVIRSHGGSGFLTEKTDRRPCCVVSNSALAVTVLCRTLCPFSPWKSYQSLPSVCMERGEYIVNAGISRKLCKFSLLNHTPRACLLPPLAHDVPSIYDSVVAQECCLQKAVMIPHGGPLRVS